MRSIKQLLRQPIKTLTGIILVALAVAILCVCVGQAAAAANMRTAMEASYKTVALPTGKFLYEEDLESTEEWIRQLIEENPDVVLQDSRLGLASAWIEDLSPDNYVRYLRSSVATHAQNGVLVADPRGAPYTGAMLEITLQNYVVNMVDLEGSYVLELRGTVERVLALEEGYNDPVGYGIYLYVTVEDQDALKALTDQLVEGSRYLVYGTDYTDKDWLLRSFMIEDTVAGNGDGYSATAGEGFEVQKFTPENLFFINGETEEEWQALIDRGQMLKNVAYYRQDFVKEDGTKDYYIEAFTAWEMVRYYNKVMLTLTDYSQLTGNADHQTPTLIALEGTAEEFLASEAGKLWAQALQQTEISNHTFPIAGVDDLRFVADFATQNTVISEGRIFTDEELANGARVCVISDVLAQRNGLSVGDTICARYFSADTTSPLYTDISQNQGIINATADFFTAGAVMDEEATEYTVVGIYSQSYLWDTTAENLYAFTPNTIFVPKTAVTGEMKYGTNGMFRTLLLKNGSVTEFSALLSAAGLESLYTCYDQGYSDLVDNLFSYDMIAEQALQIGLIVYGIVIGLYLLLFPGRQGKELATMSSLGTGRGRRIVHMLLSSLGILLPGTLLGILLGIALRQEVLDALTQTVSVVLPLEMDAQSLVQVGLLQFLAAILLTAAVALPMTRNRSLMQRRGILEYIGQLRKMPLHTWAAALLALIMSVALCALNASNEAEYANFEKARQEVPVTVTVTDPKGEKSTDMDLKGWVADIFSGEYDWGLSDYLTNVSIKMHQTIETVNAKPADLRLQGLMSIDSAPELSPATGSRVTWFDGYDESILLTYEPVCLVPEGFTEDADPTTPEQEVALYFFREWKETDSMGVVTDSGTFEYSCTLTVAGTYVSSVGAQDIYAPYYIARTASTKLGVSPTLHSASAVLKDNETLEEFLEVAYKYFLEPGPDADPKGLRVYGLKVEVGSLKKAEAVLNNSITVNTISTYLVFILSAGAGFFLGFLMIRSRKRDIILMRTLGKPNFRIYLDFAREQMLRVILGAAVGGAAFMWKPLDRLGWFVAVYFVGLSAALILFLGSKLITNMKEDE